MPCIPTVGIKLHGLMGLEWIFGFFCDVVLGLVLRWKEYGVISSRNSMTRMRGSIWCTCYHIVVRLGHQASIEMLFLLAIAMVG